MISGNQRGRKLVSWKRTAFLPQPPKETLGNARIPRHVVDGMGTQPCGQASFPVTMEEALRHSLPSADEQKTTYLIHMSTEASRKSQVGWASLEELR